MSQPVPDRTDHIAPRLHLPGFNCPHCGVRAQQQWHGLGYEDYDGNETYWTSLESAPGQVNNDPGQFGVPPQINLWHGARCYSCQQWSIWYRDTLVYPPIHIGAPPNLDMPAEIQLLYNEARQVAAVSRRAGAALARAAVERLLKILDPKAPSGSNLDSRISRLRPRVSTPLAQLLDVVRVTGNQALHVDDQPAELVLLVLDGTVGPQMLETLLQAANDLVDELITRPRRTQELWDKLPEGVRKKFTDESS